MRWWKNIHWCRSCSGTSSRYNSGRCRVVEVVVVAVAEVVEEESIEILMVIVIVGPNVSLLLIINDERMIKSYNRSRMQLIASHARHSTLSLLCRLLSNENTNRPYWVAGIDLTLYSTGHQPTVLSIIRIRRSPLVCSVVLPT